MNNAYRSKIIYKKWVKPKKNLFPTGSRVYKGYQGSGKSLSMVKYALDVVKAYPNCQVYSNMIIKGIDNFNFINSDSELKEALSLRNGTDGVLVLLDEAHLYFGKRGGIPLDVLTAISQQRKDRRRLVFSSQIWEELDISLRKQVKEIVSCRCVFGCVQINTISNGETLSYDKLAGEYVAKRFALKSLNIMLSCIILTILIRRLYLMMSILVLLHQLNLLLFSPFLRLQDEDSDSKNKKIYPDDDDFIIGS